MKKQRKNGVDLKNPDFWKYLGCRLNEIAGHRIRVFDDVTSQPLTFTIVATPVFIYKRAIQGKTGLD